MTDSMTLIRRVAMQGETEKDLILCDVNGVHMDQPNNQSIVASNEWLLLSDSTTNFLEVYYFLDGVSLLLDPQTVFGNKR